MAKRQREHTAKCEHKTFAPTPMHKGNARIRESNKHELMANRKRVTFTANAKHIE